MKKFALSALLVFATIATVAVIGAPAQASNNSGQGCLDPKNPRSFEASMKTRGEGTITTKDGRPLCSDATMVMQSFNVPDT